MLIQQVLAGAAITSSLLAGVISCENDPLDRKGVVVQRIENGVGGIDLRVKRNSDESIDRHAYSTPQVECKVGALWPDCVRDNR